jgi:hypothetical protein
VNHACCGEPEVSAARRGSEASTAANGLALAAAPTFALMALLTGLSSDRSDLLCMDMPDASPLNGMALMYALMSVLHAGPWLKAISRRVSGSDSWA